MDDKSDDGGRVTATTERKLELPHWDMTPVYASLESAELANDFADVVGAIGKIRDLFDKHGVRKSEEDGTSVAIFEEVTSELNATRDRVRTLSAYLSSFVSTDSRNDLAQAKLSELQNALVELSKLGTRFQAWIGSLDVDRLIDASAVAAAHAFALRKAEVAAAHQMSESEEDLAASLGPAGSGAWSRLHGNVTSRLMVRVALPDGERELPMSAVRGLAHDSDENVRRIAYEAEVAGWETVSVPLAAAMNSIKGWTNTLNERRGWRDSLDPVLHANNVDRRTLEAMQEACVESFPDFRRYLRAKARLLGKSQLAWWDLFAPAGGATSKFWSWDDATAFIVEQFGSYSDKLAALAARAFRERWVDAEPRLGKRDGAFCMGLRADESRVMLNYEPSFDSVGTLAHELGHAYHNTNLADRTPMQRETPMALAETASIFCQTIVVNAVLKDATGDERIAIIETDLQDACQVVVDIHSRFLLEKFVFEGRSKRELSVNELNEQMLHAQRETYGDGLDPDALHKFMWAMKPHYYGSSYYNWPYTFGLLFGLGLYAQYRADPETFRAGYDALLASTGLDDAATLCARFGFDVRTPDFWRGSLDQIRSRIDEFERLVGDTHIRTAAI
jgi:pepF/M3 family oligoendopeptidase